MPLWRAPSSTSCRSTTHQSSRDWRQWCPTRSSVQSGKPTFQSSLVVYVLFARGEHIPKLWTMWSGTGWKGGCRRRSVSPKESVAWTRRGQTWLARKLPSSVCTHVNGCVCDLNFANVSENDSIVPLHKSQCALRCRDTMSKIQNTSSQRSLATWLTVAANEQNDDWPVSVSLVSVQPVIGWLKDEVARHWSLIVHRPRPHGNLPLPCIVRNGVWYCVKYSSLKSFYVLQSIPNHETKFCGSVVWVRWQQIEKYIWYFAGLSQVFIF